MTVPNLLIRLAAATVLVAAACGGETTEPTGGSPPVSSVRVTPADPTVVIGATVALQAIVTDQAGRPLEGRQVLWTAVPATTATVSQAGVVTALAEGEAIVTASAGGRLGTARVLVVSPAVASVELDITAADLEEGQAIQLTATPRAEDGQPIAGRAIQWSSSAPGVVSVSALGEVTALRPGSATITARVHGKTAAAEVGVTATHTHDLLFSAWPGVHGLAAALWVLDPRNPEPATQPIREAGLAGAEPAPSPDGRRVAYTMHNFLSLNDIRIYDRTSGQGWTLVGGPGAESSAAWSPDGEWIAFIRRPVGLGGQLWIVRADGTGAVKVAGEDGEDLMRPTWSPVLPGGEQRIAFVRSANGVGHIYSVRPDGTGRQQITNGETFDDEPAWSPDGTTIAFRRNAIGAAIWLVDAQGGNTRLLIDLPLHQFSPAWSPDGRLIAFTSNHEAGVQEIYTVWTTGAARLARRTSGGMDKTRPTWVRRP